MNDKEQQESIDRRRFFRYVALTTLGVPAMKAASIAQQEAERWRWVTFSVPGKP